MTVRGPSPVESETVGKILSLRTGTIATLVSYAAEFGVSLVITRWAFHLLGTERFGAWLALAAAAAYIGLANLGIANALINASARARAVGDSAALRATYSTGFAALGALGLLGVAVVVPIASWAPLAHWFSIDASYADELRDATIVLVVLSAARLPGSAIVAVQTGISEVARARVWQTIGGVLQLAGAYVVVLHRGGMASLAAAFAGGPVLAQALAAVDLAARHRALRLSPRSVSRPEARALLVPSGAFFLQQLAGTVIVNTDNVVIATRLGAARVPGYAIPYRMASWASLLSTVALPSAWPVLAEAHARDDRAALRSVFVSLLRAATAVACGAAVLVVVFGDDLASAWLGTAPPFDRSVLWIVSAYALLLAVETVSITVLNATGRVMEPVRAAMPAAALNLLLSIALARPLGVAGVAVGTLAAAAATTGWAMFVRACRAVEAPPRTVLRLATWRWPLAAAALVPVAALAKHASVPGAPAAACAIGLGAAYLFAVWRIALTRAERSALLRRRADS